MLLADCARSSSSCTAADRAPFVTTVGIQYMICQQILQYYCIEMEMSISRCRVTSHEAVVQILFWLRLKPSCHEINSLTQTLSDLPHYNCHNDSEERQGLRVDESYVGRNTRVLYGVYAPLKARRTLQCKHEMMRFVFYYFLQAV